MLVCFKTIGPIVDWHANVMGFGLSQKSPSGIKINVAAMEGRGSKGLPRGPLSKYYRAFTSEFPLVQGRLPVTVREPAAADANYLHRLLAISKHINPTTLHCLHALDNVYDKKGALVPELTLLHVPNEYVWVQAIDNPDSFFPGFSIHPYRKDAVAQLESWATKTAEAGLPLVIVWHPSVMGIDLLSDRAAKFYQALAQYTHAILYVSIGEETHMPDPNPEFGNPLALRAPLDAGLIVMAGSCGLDGKSEDTDMEKNPALVSNWSLFYRLFESDKYKDTLFGCLTTFTSTSSPAGIAAVLLRDPSTHNRLAYGSNYPAPELKDRYASVRLSRFLSSKKSDKELQAEFEALQALNPVLADIIIKRSISAPGTADSESPVRLPASVFQTKSLLFKKAERKVKAVAASPAQLSVEIESSQNLNQVKPVSPTTPGSPGAMVLNGSDLRTPAPQEPISVVFVLSGLSTSPGDRVSVVGSVAGLGNWDLASAPKLVPNEADGLWATTVTVPVGHLMSQDDADSRVEFKYVKVSMDGVVTWEPLPSNRVLKVSSLASLYLLGAVRETSVWGEPASPSGILGSPVSPSKLSTGGVAV